MIKEMERIRVEIHNPQEAVPLILQPKILNYNNTIFAGNHREIGSLTPTPAPTWGTSPNERAYVIQDPKETFIPPNKKDHGNFVNNNTFNTNSMDLDA